MSALTERRAHPRIDVNGKVRFKGVQMEQLEEGELENISQSGILLRTPHRFQLGDMLFIMLEPDEPGPAPIEMKARIVRSQLADGDAQVGYGCLIVETTEP